MLALQSLAANWSAAAFRPPRDGPKRVISWRRAGGCRAPAAGSWARLMVEPTGTSQMINPVVPARPTTPSRFRAAPRRAASVHLHAEMIIVRRYPRGRFRIDARGQVSRWTPRRSKPRLRSEQASGAIWPTHPRYRTGQPTRCTRRLTSPAPSGDGLPPLRDNSLRLPNDEHLRSPTRDGRMSQLSCAESPTCPYRIGRYTLRSQREMTAAVTNPAATGTITWSRSRRDRDRDRDRQ